MNLSSKFENVRVLVVGDVMLDRYWWGDVTRISPEAPVPVVRLNKTTLAPGGAANVATNIAGLGSTAILIGCVGDDAEAEQLKEVLSESGTSANGLVTISGRQTTVKTRIIAHSQQVARIDQETQAQPDLEQEEEILAKVLDLIDGVQTVVLSDYSKGVLSESTTRKVISAANKLNVPVIVDPKGRSYDKYNGAKLLTPNSKEAADACALDEYQEDAVSSAGQMILSDFDLGAVLITQGAAGMTLFTKEANPFFLHACARQVYDVTGAGDTVVATLAAAIGAGCDLPTAARIANAAAGLVVEQLGTTHVNIEELSQVFRPE